MRRRTRSRGVVGVPSMRFSWYSYPVTSNPLCVSQERAMTPLPGVAARFVGVAGPDWSAATATVENTATATPMTTANTAAIRK